MSQALYSPSASTAYRAARTMTRRQRLAVWTAVAAVHAALLAGLLATKIGKTETVPEPLRVSFITEQAAAQPLVSPPPPPPPPPAPSPRMIASPRTTPSPISAPPMQETVRQDAAAAPQQPPQPPAPPAAAVVAAAPAAPAAPAAAVIPPSYTAAYLRNPGPRMPELARRERHEGIVRLRVQVAADGSPEKVTVQRSSGFPELDAAALEVVSTRWKFAPARQGDRAVPGTVDVPIQFKITR